MNCITVAHHTRIVSCSVTKEAAAFSACAVFLISSLVTQFLLNPVSFTICHLHQVDAKINKHVLTQTAKEFTEMSCTIVKTELNLLR